MGKLRSLILILFVAFLISGCGASPGTGDTTSASSLSGKVRLTAKVSIASGKSSSETVNATVYAIGQESNKVTTNSNGEFTLLIDAKQSGTVLQKSGALPRESTTPAKNQYGIIVASGTGGYGKKIEITGNDGDDVTLPSPVEITEVGSISGTVTLQNQTDNTGIMVYIPGTSFMALTDASGSFTISGVPEGTYLILRAEKDGYNYSSFSNITVQSAKTTTTANQMLLVSTGSKGAIVINNGDSITTSRTVDLNVSATDNAILMTIAEDSAFLNTSWETIQSYTTHIFTSDGDKTLYIKFADANGLESTTYSDSITIDTNPRVTLLSPSGTISSTKPALTWIASTLPNPKYHVQVSTNSAFSAIYEEATNLTSTSYTLTKNLSNATTYYWRASIIDESGKGWNWSDTGTFAIDLSTVTPTSPAYASFSHDTTPTFNWSANSNAATYNLVLSTNSDLSSPVVDKTGITATSYTDTAPLANTAGIIYYWAVTPVDTNGVSGARSDIYSFTLDTTASAGSITINNGDLQTTSTTVTLTLLATDSVGVTGYYVSETSTTPLASATGWTSVTSTTSYSANTSFTLSSGSGIKTIYVWFKDAAGNMSSSISNSIGIPSYAPTGVSAIAGDNQSTISWTASTGATSYNIYWSTTTGVTTTTGTKITGATSPYTHNGLTNGTTYYYIVTAVSLGGESAVSSQTSAMPVPPVPSAPTGVSATAGNTQATISWTAVTGATSYNVYYSTTAGVTTASGTKITNATSGSAITGLTNGTTYYYIVTAVNLGGESAASAQVSAMPVPPVPSAPTGVSATAGNGQNTVSWISVSGATSYNIYWSTTAGVTTATGTKVTGATSPYIHTALTNGTTYYYIVTAVNLGGEGAASAEASATPQSPVLMGGSMQGNPLNLTNTVTTFAGSAGVVGSADGTGTAAGFNYPQGMTTDGTNLFIADYYNHTIRQIVISTGAVTTIAGSAGLAGLADGTGTAARFNLPIGITTDGINLFVADTYNHTIRKIVISTGAVTTVAGSAGSTGSTDGTGTAARFKNPYRITTAGTNLFVSDTSNHTIRKIVISTGAVTTVAGSAGLAGSADGTGTPARFNSPLGITTDGTNLFIADYANSTIRKIIIATGAVTTIAGSAGLTGLTDGIGTAARLNLPQDITTDGTNLFVADPGMTNNNSIRKVVISTGLVTTIATGFTWPQGITTDGVNLYIADRDIIRKIQ